MKYLIIIFLFTVYACSKNPNRVEEMSANNGKNYVKKYFKNNSKIKMEVYDKKTNKLLTVTDFEKETITKITEFHSNQKKKLIATLLQKPNFFGVKNYSENGKMESEGSLLFNYKKNILNPVSDWLFYNKQTGEADSIGHYFSDGNVSLLVEVERIDNKNKKITKIKYFEVKQKHTLSDSITWQVKRIR